MAFLAGRARQKRGLREISGLGKTGGRLSAAAVAFLSFPLRTEATLRSASLSADHPALVPACQSGPPEQPRHITARAVHTQTHVVDGQIFTRVRQRRVLETVLGQTRFLQACRSMCNHKQQEGSTAHECQLRCRQSTSESAVHRTGG